MADDAWFEAVEDTLREHDSHIAASYSVHGGMVWYVAGSGTPPTSPPTGLPWWRPDTKEAVINTGTSGSPVWESGFVDLYKLTSADLVTDYVVSGLLASVPGSGLALSVPSGVAIITGKRVVKSSASWSVPAGKWTFVDLINTGAFANVDNGVLLDDCEDTWLEHTDADITQSIVAGQVGNALRLAVASGASAGDFVSEAIPSTDISGYGKIKMRIRSSVGTSAGDLQLLLDNTAAVASPVHTLNIPGLTANTWTTVELAYTATTGSDAIISIGMKYTVDIGAANVDIDDIWAVESAEPAVSTNGIRLMEVKADANIAQVSVVDITSAINSTLYTVQINGVDVTYTSDASATEGEIALGLVAAVNASVAPGVTPVTASTTAIASDTSATLTLTADVAGVAFTIAVGANLSVTTTVPNSTANVYEVNDKRNLNPTVRGAEGGSPHNFWSSTHPDIDVADTPANGEVVTWDSTTAKWKASPPSGAANHNLFSSTHPDVDATDTPADGEVLTYDSASGKWKSSSSASAGFTPPFVKTGSNIIYAAWGDGNPAPLVEKREILASLTNTNLSASTLTTSVGRFVAFRLPKAHSVGHVWVFPEQSSTNIFRFYIYRLSDGVRIWDSGTVTTVATTWLDITANTPISLAASTNYAFGIAAVSTGASAVWVTWPQNSNSAFLGASAAPLGGLSAGVPEVFQVAATTGVVADPLPSKSAVPASSPNVPFAFLQGTAS